MDLNKSKLAEKMLLFLFGLSENADQVNVNTYKRYIYLYYLTSSFLNGGSETVDIAIEKGDIRIINFDTVINEFVVRDFIVLDDNQISVQQPLKIFVSSLLGNKNGAFYYQYREIQPFINLLQSYNDQFIFTIFFSEPTFKEASLRGVRELHSSSSKLSSLLEQFKSRLDDSNIDEYDILTYWMDYILKNYYIEEGDCGDES